VNTTLRTLNRLAFALNVDPTELFAARPGTGSAAPGSKRSPPKP
jgi:hypothetical protein